MLTAKLEMEKKQDPSGITVTTLTGKLVIETVHEFLQVLREDRSGLMVLDLSEVSFLDSAGVGAIVQLFVHRKSAGLKFALIGLRAQGRAVLEVSGLLSLLPIYATAREVPQANA